MQVWNLNLLSGTLGIPSGGGGSAAHRPPHLREETNIVGESMTGTSPDLYNRGTGVPWEPKSIQDAPQTSQETPKSVQEEPKMCPRGPNSSPRSAKSQASSAQEVPKRGPDPCKTKPGESQNEFLAQSFRAAVFDRLLNRFYVVFWLARQDGDM